MNLRELAQLYAEGRNISAYLRDITGVHHNTEDIIEAAYDMQTGSYVRALNTPVHAVFADAYTTALAGILNSLGSIGSILEAGVGEGTTMSAVLGKLKATQPVTFAFDLSWSRTACCRGYMTKRGFPNVKFCTATLSALPFADNSIDVVYTSHAIEPNGGRENQICAELLRVTKKFLVLLEPAYELASDEARARMTSHGYCRNLPETLRSMGADIVRHELFSHSVNPLNPTGLILVRKDGKGPETRPDFACPATRTPLKYAKDCLYSEEGMLAYPIVGGIPCLRTEKAIIASKFLEYPETP